MGSTRYGCCGGGVNALAKRQGRGAWLVAKKASAPDLDRGVVKEKGRTRITMRTFGEAISAWLILMVVGRLPQFIAHKWILLTAVMLTIIATILLPLGDSLSNYWRFNFPAFIIGSIAMMVTYLIQYAPVVTSDLIVPTPR